MDAYLLEYHIVYRFYLLEYQIVYGFYVFCYHSVPFFCIIWGLTLLILEMDVLVRTGITEITEKKSSVISVIQRADQRSEISLEVFSDPPFGLLRLLNLFFSNLSNPDGGSEKTSREIPDL